jgi:tripartite-type tricarboxylate transporter receptor subunit TctC
MPAPTRPSPRIQHDTERMSRRALLLGASAAPWMLSSAGAQTAADAYPSRPIKLIVGFTPGSIGDLFVRALAQLMAPQLGQPIVVDNKPGASQVIGAELAARAAPDGYTLYLGTQGGLVLNAVVRKKLPYDPIADFSPITMMFVTPMYLYVNPSVPAKNTAELIALAKSKPGKLTFASIGPVTAAHVLGEMFKSEAGVDMLHVPFKGGPEATNALISGQVDIFFNGNNSMSQVKQGKARVIASAGVKRSEERPDLATIAEAGVPGVDLLPWFGLFGPAGMPRPLVDRLNREFVAVLKSPAMKERATQMGVEIVTSTPAALTNQIKVETPQLSKVLLKAGVTPE